MKASLLDAYREHLRRGADPAVARARVRTALLQRRQSPETVARHIDRITGILDRVEREVAEEMEAYGPGAA